MKEKEAPGIRGAIRRTSAFIARRRLVLAAMLGGLVFTDLVVVGSLPAMYRATAAVAVEPARLPDDVKPLVPSVQERIGRLTGIALSEATLGQLARECPRLARPHLLDAFQNGTSSPIELLRERIAVETKGRGDRTELVLVCVTGERADETAHVASSIASQLVALDKAFRIEAASAIHSAVVAAAKADRKPIEDLSQEIDKLRAANPVIVTTSDQAIRAELEQEARGLEEDTVAQAELAASLPILESETQRWALAVQEEAEAARRAAAAAEAAKTPQPKSAPSSDDPRRARLVELEKQLVQARSHWTEQNPEVKRLLREIALEREYLGEPDTDEEPAPSSPTPPAQTPATPEKSDAPKQEGAPKEAPRVGQLDRAVDVRPAADVQRIETRFVIEAPAYKSWRESIGKLEAARTRDTALKARIARRTGEVARLKDLVEKLPRTRLELARLESERDRLAARLGESQEHLSRVERAWAIELSDGHAGACTERLALAGPVLVPEYQLGPDRVWAFLIGLLVAAPVAMVAAYVRDVQDRSFHTDEEVASGLDLPVLGVIPRLRGRR